MATLHASSFNLKQNGMNMSYTLKVSLHDNLGNEFSHDAQDTLIMVPKLATQHDIEVNLGNNFTVSLILRRETTNVLSISLKNVVGLKCEDLVKVSVSKYTGNMPTKEILTSENLIDFT